MIRVQDLDFDIGAEIAALRAGRSDIGAMAAFAGIVRDHASSSDVSAMTLEHYPGMTERELERIEKEAHARWPLIASTIIHRVGRLLPGENIVLVAVASAHREAAFAAAQFLMDYLKTEAPFWKREEMGEGERWVEERAADREAAARWE